MVHSLPEPAEGGERLGGVGSRIDKNCFVVQRAETSIEVIAVGVDQMERDDRDIQFGHGMAEFFNTAQGRTKTITGIDERPVRMPKEVAMAFEVVGTKIDFDDLETVLEVPVHVKSDLAPP
jgi:hypothetical protein